MSNNRDLLKEAIADAKAVKETAIANAKAALEEAFTPHLKSMLAAKLEEMDKDDVDEGYDKYEEDDVKMEEVNETEEVTEVEEIEEEINLDELLAELEEGEDKDEVKESEEIEESEEVTEQEEDEAEEEGEDEEAEGEMEEEEIDLEDMTEDDLKSFIEDVIKDMVEAGELEAGEEMKMDDEESEMDMDIEVEDEEEEIMEMDEVSWNEKNNPTRGASKKELDPKKVGKSTAAYAINEEEVTEGDPDAAARGLENIINFVIKNAKKGKDWLKKNVEKGSMQQAMTEMEIEEGDPDAAARGLENIINFVMKNASKGADWLKKNVKVGSMQDAMTSEALAEIEELKKELQEVNLLNAKLLYTNKIFKSKNLSEDKKVKVLKAFDKAATVKEAKVIFETLNEGMSSKMTKSPINEVKGSASKATGVAPKAKQPIVENAAFARMQKLAGIIKEN